VSPKPTQTQRDLFHLLRTLSYQEGEFTLASGRKSNYYLDCRTTLLHPEGLHLAGIALFDLWVQHEQVGDAVAGMSVGADPMVCAFMLQARRRGFKVNGLFVRKQPKGHGTKVWVEGVDGLGTPEGVMTKVLVLDDVVTSGGSTIHTIEKLRDAGLAPLKAFCLVDREEGGIDNVKSRTGITVHALFKASDFRS